jgi:endogenous inhibitor of DNA gyrase (YacG/DUF329 family)
MFDPGPLDPPQLVSHRCQNCNKLFRAEPHVRYCSFPCRRIDLSRIEALQNELPDATAALRGYQHCISGAPPPRERKARRARPHSPMLGSVARIVGEIP